MGIGGDTVRDLKNRWQTDVMNLQPDWLSVCIGINDVWRFFATPPRVEEHVPINEYAKTLEALVQETRPFLKGLLLMTPYMVTSDRAEPMRVMMDKYGNVVRHIAENIKPSLLILRLPLTLLERMFLSLLWLRIRCTQPRQGI